MKDVVSSAPALRKLLEEARAETLGMRVERDALRIHIQTLRALCDREMERGLRCRLCGQKVVHSDTCMTRASTGYDLLQEHEDTVHENDELRAMLAKHMPRGQEILAGAKPSSARARLSSWYELKTASNGTSHGPEAGGQSAS